MKILVADDDADLRALVSFTLSRAGFDVATANDGESALRQFNLESPDFVLLDINMPAPDGLEVCRRLRTRSTAPIMMLTVRSDEEDLIAAVDAGADDFVRKPFSPRTLVARVRALARRIEPPHEGPIVAGRYTLDVDDYTLYIDEAPVRLTPLEFKALHVLITTPGRTVTLDKLLTHLWGAASSRERRTLKQLIYRLRRKLERDPAQPEILLTTPGAGYKLCIS